MVKKNFFRMLFVAAALSVGSCASNGDIDDLQDQLGDLEGQVGDLEGDLTRLEQEQQAELAAEIAALQAEITALQGETDGLSSDYDALLASLTETQEEIAAGAKVFYGSVITDAEFDELLTSEATIVTGSVNVTKDSHLTSMANVALVGGDLVVEGVSNADFAVLETISKSLIVENTAATSVSFSMLKSVGGYLSIKNNSDLESVDIAELLLINSNFMFSDNDMATTLKMAKLDLVAGNVMVNNSVGSYGEKGLLSEIDFSSTDVMGNVSLESLGIANEDNSKLSFGSVEGDFLLDNCGTYSLEILSEEIGALVMSSNGYLVELSTPNLTTINGDLTIYYNVPSGVQMGGGSGVTGWTELTGFDALETIVGKVSVQYNKFNSIDAFNNVTTVGSGWDGYIDFSSNGDNTLINVFNALIYAGGNAPKYTIIINEKTDWFNGFESLNEVKNLTLRIVKKQGSYDFNCGCYEGQGDFAKIEGFNALVKVHNSIDLNFGQATEVDAFAVLSDLSQPGNFTLTIPEDAALSLCSMNTVLSGLRDGTYNPNNWSWYVPTYYFSNGYMVATQADVDPYIADCI